MRYGFSTTWERLRLLWMALPYGWLFLFFLVPFCMLLGISFSESMTGTPPYAPILKWLDDVLEIRLSLSNYTFIFMDELYIAAYLNSIALAFCSTLGCLVIGYPLAYGIVCAPPRWKLVLLLLVIVPFWISFLLRVYAWMLLLSPHGLINHFLMSIGLIEAPLALMGKGFSVWIGMVYSYLPFMVLPLYASLDKVDFSLLEAAYDLGCRPFKAFWKVIFPLSLPGALAGSLLVFIPAAGEFVVPELLGGSKVLMIGKLLWDDFFVNRDWPVASALAVLILMLLIFPMMLLQRFQKRFSP